MKKKISKLLLLAAFATMITAGCSSSEKASATTDTTTTDTTITDTSGVDTAKVDTTRTM